MTHPFSTIAPISNFASMRVVVSPLCSRAKLQVSPHCPCTDYQRDKTNAYLLETFGTKEDIYLIGDNTVVMSERVKRELMSDLAARYNSSIINLTNFT